MPRILLVNDRAPKTSFDLDVVFLHGLDGDPEKTWSQGSPERFWPAWIADDLPNVRVLSVGYDAASTKWKRGTSARLSELGVTVLTSLRQWNVGSRPVCFVTHSLGGLLAKKMLLQAAYHRPEYAEISDRTRAVVFLATPHDGAAIARFAHVYGLLRPAPLLVDLVDNSVALLELHHDYNNWVARRDDAAAAVTHRVFHETEPPWMLRWTTGECVVPRASADPRLVGVSSVAVPGASHSGICKPRDREDIVYQEVKGLLEGLLGPYREPVRVARDTDLAVSQRSRDEARVFGSRGWYRSLVDLYPHHRPLSYAGVDFPIWAKAADPEEWSPLDRALGRLSGGEDPRQPSYPEDFNPKGRSIYERKLATVNGETSFNGATYALDQIVFEGGRFTVNAKHGTYFHSLATSEYLEEEFLAQLVDDPDRAITLADLDHRKDLHRLAGDENVLFDGRGRAAALSVAATVLVTEPDGTYSAILPRRSAKVETHPLLKHVAPSGIFAPISADRRDDPSEFSIRRCVLREYAEELFGYKDLEQGRGVLAEDVTSLRPVRALLEAENSGKVALRYCGVAVPLLTLRPEIYVLVFIMDPSWLDQEIHRSRDTDHWFQLNWEYATSQKLDDVKFRLDADFEPLDRSTVQPTLMVPHAAAALHLCTSVARTMTAKRTE